MDKNTLKNKLIKSELFESDSSIRAIMNGTRYPSYSKAVKLEDEQKIPISAWKDIKSFITDNNSSNQSTKSSTENKEKVAV